MGYGSRGINGALRWKDLAMDELLPVDETKEEAKRAMQARKMASGASHHNPQPSHHQAPQNPPDQTMDEEDEEENNENESGEGDEEEEDDESEDEV